MGRNKLLVPGSGDVLNQMKEEIANEFGVQLGADTTARANGSVGGEMTKRPSGRFIVLKNNIVKKIPENSQEFLSFLI